MRACVDACLLPHRPHAAARRMKKDSEIQERTELRMEVSVRVRINVVGSGTYDVHPRFVQDSFPFKGQRRKHIFFLDYDVDARSLFTQPFLKKVSSFRQIDYCLYCSSIMTLAENHTENVELEQETQATVVDGVPQPPAEKEPEEAAAVEPALEKTQSFMQAATSEALRPFVIISSSYLLFTITDGAIRMIVLLHAYTKKFSAFEVAIMFTLYELAGVFTNLVSVYKKQTNQSISLSCLLNPNFSFSLSTTGCWFHGRTVGHQIYVG